MKKSKTKVIPLEEIVFAKHMGKLKEDFALGKRGRLPPHVRDSNLFKGFTDGYFDRPHKYDNMVSWKKRSIEFFIGGDQITSYELSYFWGKECRENRSLPDFQFVELARV